MKTEVTMCNCEYCIPCETCGHQADEHLAGEGHCFKCNCSKHTSKIFDAWDKLPVAIQTTMSFKKFADSYSERV